MNSLSFLAICLGVTLAALGVITVVLINYIVNLHSPEYEEKRRSNKE